MPPIVVYAGGARPLTGDGLQLFLLAESLVSGDDGPMPLAYAGARESEGETEEFPPPVPLGSRYLRVNPLSPSDHDAFEYNIEHHDGTSVSLLSYNLCAPMRRCHSDENGSPQTYFNNPYLRTEIKTKGIERQKRGFARLCERVHESQISTTEDTIAAIALQECHLSAHVLRQVMKTTCAGQLIEYHSYFVADRGNESTNSVVLIVRDANAVAIDMKTIFEDWCPTQLAYKDYQTGETKHRVVMALSEKYQTVFVAAHLKWYHKVHDRKAYEQLLAEMKTLVNALLSTNPGAKRVHLFGDLNFERDGDDMLPKRPHSVEGEVRSRLPDTRLTFGMDEFARDLAHGSVWSKRVAVYIPCTYGNGRRVGGDQQGVALATTADCAIVFESSVDYV